MKKQNKKIIRKKYAEIAEKKCGCQCGCTSSNEEIAEQIGYSKKEIEKFADSNLGLGCGNPLALSKIKTGEIVVDLGSGAGFDAFLAREKVGEFGKVVGIDMTEKMIEKARQNAKRYGYGNVEFKLGDIEKIPLKENFADAVISNCVINLAPDKDKVFAEVYRILKKGGRMYISDIVLLEELTSRQKSDEKLLVGCVAGALQKNDYLNKIKNAGFKVKILDENKSISKTQYAGINLESIKVEAIK